MFNLNTQIIFFLLSILYVYGIAIEKLLITQDIEPFSDNHFIYVKVVLLMLAATISFFTGYSLTKLKKLEIWSHNNPFKGGSIGNITATSFLAFSSIITFLLFFLLYSSEIFQSLSYKGNSEITYENSFYSFFKSTCYALTGISIGLCLHRNKFSLFANTLLVSLFLFGVVTSDKDPMVISILALFSSHKLFNRKIGLRTLFLIVVGMFFLAYLSRVFSSFRGGADFFTSLHYASGQISFSSLDGRGPFHSILTAIGSNQDPLLGSSYLTQAINLIPKFIYPGERPPDIAVLYAMREMKSWSGGMGLGFSPLAEGYMNFGSIGVIIQFFFVGIIWGALWSCVYNIMIKITYFERNSFIVIYRIIGFYLLLLLFRSPALFFIKNMIYIFVPFFIQLLIFNLLSRITRDESSMGSQLQ